MPVPERHVRRKAVVYGQDRGYGSAFRGRREVLQYSDEPAGKASSTDEAYNAVLARLRNGSIGPEDRIVDKALAAELEMSRMPAREALRRLVSEGYLVGTTRGFMLPALSSGDILEIFDIRRALEPRAAALAAARGSTLDLDALGAAMRDARLAWSADDVAALTLANNRFRQIWLDAVPNRRLAMLIARYSDHVNAVRRVTLSDHASQGLAVTISGALFEGFSRGDTLQVYEQMTRFIEAGRAQFVALSA